MNYVRIPNLPEAEVSLAVVDGRLDEAMEAKLLDLKVKLIKTDRHTGLYEAVSYHPDMMLHHLGDECIVYSPGVADSIKNALSDCGFQLIQGGTTLQEKYPWDIAYNVARVGKFAFHNLKYTDPVLRNELEKRDVELVHVKQGYSKCSVSVIDENSIITADRGIAKAAQEKGVEVLLIEPEEEILLPGLSNGFIGGSTAMLNKYRWAVAGNFAFFRAADRIRRFLEDRNIEIISLSEGRITDIGSIIPLLVK